jgi:hypothetical protein
MAVRNFWLEATIDGRQTDLSGGPRAKDGGFELTVYVRQRGSILRAVKVSGYAFEGFGNGDKDTLRIAVSTEKDARNGASYTQGSDIIIETER